MKNRRVTTTWRLTSHIDSANQEVQYEYDELGRVVKLTPPRGIGWECEYTYNENGSLSQARINDSGTPADTDYGYDTTSGELLTRDFPVDSGQNIRTTYAYDSAGRLQYETVTYSLKVVPPLM